MFHVKRHAWTFVIGRKLPLYFGVGGTQEKGPD
jgi:hypothetical protein